MLTELASTIERVFPHTNTYFTIVLIYFLVVFFSSHIEKVGFSRIQGIFNILSNVRLKQHLRTAIQRCPIWDNAESAFSYFYGKYSLVCAQFATLSRINHKYLFFLAHEFCLLGAGGSLKQIHCALSIKDESNLNRQPVLYEARGRKRPPVMSWG